MSFFFPVPFLSVSFRWMTHSVPKSPHLIPFGEYFKILSWLFLYLR